MSEILGFIIIPLLFLLLFAGFLYFTYQMILKHAIPQIIKAVQESLNNSQDRADKNRTNALD